MKQAFGNQGTEARQAASRLCIWLLAGFLGAAALVAGGALTAAEVYTWTDENGVLHYSDTPRTNGPMETIEAEEAYRPGSADAYPAAAPQEAQTVTEAIEAPQSAADARREELARQREERRESQAETDRLCAQHQQRLEQMEPSRRVFYTDEAGETVRMDDEERVGLVAESRAFVDKNCQD